MGQSCDLDFNIYNSLLCDQQLITAGLFRHHIAPECRLLEFWQEAFRLKTQKKKKKKVISLKLSSALLMMTLLV